MQIKTEFINIPIGDTTMRAFVAAPATAGRYPGIVLFTDIFQLGDSVCRTIGRLAGYGFVIAAHEIFHRHEPVGTVLEQNDAGIARGMAAQKVMPVAQFDSDCRAVIATLQQHPQVDADKLGATGFCIGGHLAFRAALQPEIKAAVCFYPSWLHSGLLGAGQQADSLQRAADIRGELLVLFGSLDTLVPPAGRATIEAALQQGGVKYETRLYEAAHGFVREDRATHDPECTDAAMAETVKWFQRVLA
ncbi:MAG: dienelactone hydrolase family protein [Acidobacteria bacterium]|nr:dienelactone hydrolase family protein [Acidobacteriota bacterium]